MDVCTFLLEIELLWECVCVGGRNAVTKFKYKVQANSALTYPLSQFSAQFAVDEFPFVCVSGWLVHIVNRKCVRKYLRGAKFIAIFAFSHGFRSSCRRRRRRRTWACAFGGKCLFMMISYSLCQRRALVDEIHNVAAQCATGIRHTLGLHTTIPFQSME